MAALPTTSACTHLFGDLGVEEAAYWLSRAEALPWLGAVCIEQGAPTVKAAERTSPTPIPSAPAVTTASPAPAPSPWDSDVEDETFTETEVEAAPAEAGGPKSWASVVGVRTRQIAASEATKQNDERAIDPWSHSAVQLPANEESVEEDGSAGKPPTWWDQLSVAARGLNGHGQPPVLQPKGLVNQGNLCFMNCILQSLLACSPLVGLLHAMKQLQAEMNLSRTSLLQSFLDFYEDVSTLDFRKGTQKPLLSSKYFALQLQQFYERQDPGMFIDAQALQNGSGGGSQEDAEEWLGFLINGMHEEILEVGKRPSSSKPISVTEEVGKSNASCDCPHTTEPSNTSSVEEWKEVGKRNKLNSTRRVDLVDSPITQIFGGQMRTVVWSGPSASKASSIIIEPFHCLNLDIRNGSVHSVEDALQMLVATENLDGYTDDKTQQQVHATKKLQLEKLPQVLVLHLKRFSFEKGGHCPQKVTKFVGYSPLMNLHQKLLSSVLLSSGSERAQFKLISVVSHHGKSAAGGHYTCDCLVDSRWYEFDDSQVVGVKHKEVLQRNAYVLFYQLLPPDSKSDNKI